MKRTGHADLPLHTGTVPRWLADRMRDLGTLIVESLVLNFGKDEVLRRLSDPLWFQSFGAVLGMDWHSSGITTSVMYALKRGLNPRAHELGICVCGGRGVYSRKTPEELLYLSDATGLDGENLVKSSRLCAKVDNTAVIDGFQLYQHNFIVTNNGNWAVVQQGMNAETKTARRYHWCSLDLNSFVENPHTGVVGENSGDILNLTASNASSTRSGILTLANEEPQRIIAESAKIFADRHIQKAALNGQLDLFSNDEASLAQTAQLEKSLVSENYKTLTMPHRHHLESSDVDLSRLGAVLATAYETKPENFETLLLTPGLGPRAVQSLTLVSEVIYGTPSRFSDPARFSFAHGGKDGHPFPVPLKVYDETIRVLGDSIEKSKLGYNDKSECLKRLHNAALSIEKNCAPSVDFDAAIKHERMNSKAWGGKTVGC